MKVRIKNPIWGIPITFLYSYNPKQFEILGQMANTNITDFNFGYPFINKKKKYARILIKKKNENKNKTSYLGSTCNIYR